MKPIQVFVGIPSLGDWKAEFGMSLVGLVSQSAAPLRDGRRIEALRVWNSRGSILPRSRTTLVKQAREAGASHILFLDSDMVFPPQTLHRLLQWDKSVVACNCPVKTLPSAPTGRLAPTEEHPRGVPLMTTPDSISLKKVWRIGTGIMLVKMSVFDIIPEPWFPIAWDKELQDYRGEDWAFCDALDRAGIPIYVDEGLSRAIGHVGDFRFEHQHVQLFGEWK